MAVQPIDLQTLLVRLAEVGKEQNAQRAAAAQSQAVAGSEIARQSEEEAHSVTQAHKMGEGTENVGDDDEGGQNRDERGSRRDRRSEASSANEGVFHDPDLGRNVDLTG